MENKKYPDRYGFASSSSAVGKLIDALLFSGQTELFRKLILLIEDYKRYVENRTNIILKLPNYDCSDSRCPKNTELSLIQCSLFMTTTPTDVTRTFG